MTEGTGSRYLRHRLLKGTQLWRILAWGTVAFLPDEWLCDCACRGLFWGSCRGGPGPGNGSVRVGVIAGAFSGGVTPSAATALALTGYLGGEPGGRAAL